MILKVTKQDAMTWVVHSIVMLGIVGAIGKTTGSYEAGYALGLCVFFLKEVLENKTVEIWRWKTLDSVMDFVFPLVAGGVALRLIQ